LRTATETTAITGFASREAIDSIQHPRLVIRNPAQESSTSGIDADPDKDGLVNGIEFASHSNPLVSNDFWRTTIKPPHQRQLKIPFG
jgi:hypothetical protein